jgi:hypothetical protein
MVGCRLRSFGFGSGRFGVAGVVLRREEFLLQGLRAGVVCRDLLACRRRKDARRDWLNGRRERGLGGLL